MKEFFLSKDFLLGGELLIRILAAVLCGGAIGYERKNRGKGAGMRTHIIVALASCLMMIISQYGFDDFYNRFQTSAMELKVDPSRIAAQIVSGIGFLGAGMIFIQKNTVTGLTTAAGIWATAGIGMGIGCGMYVISGFCTIAVVVVQIALHSKKLKIFNPITEHEISFVLKHNPELITFLKQELEKREISVIHTKYKKREDNIVEIIFDVQSIGDLENEKIFDIVYDNEEVISFSV